MAALSDRAAEGNILVIDGYDPDKPGTKGFKSLLAGLG